MKEDKGKCKRCGKPKDVYTKVCSECLHIHRGECGKSNGADWVEDVKD
jgi:hypothetical protein